MRILLLVIILITIITLGFLISREIKGTELKLEPNYPRWLKTDNYRTDQTSGITYIGNKPVTDNSSMEIFLLADDVGSIHRLEIEKDTLFNFTPITFSREVQDYIDKFPKKDFEEICFDRLANQVYLSIEGNGKDYIKYHGIFKLHFKNDDVFENTIVGIEKLNITPKEEFTRYLKRNIGYEGLAIDENYIYLGLEGMLDESDNFTDSTFMFIVDKVSLKIIKKIPTKDLNISTICGLYSDSDYSLWGIDRNSRKVFKLTFNKDFTVEENLDFPINTVIPNYNEYGYMGSIESITIGNNNKLFMIDDPWTEFFVPAKNILSKLDKVTAENFKEFIPVIYKYRIIHQ